MCQTTSTDMRFLSLTLQACLTASVALGQEPRPYDAASLDSEIRAQVDSGFSGVVVVALGDSVILRRAYGPSGSRLTPTSAFWIASITKSFTAAAVLRAQERHRLSVTDSLKKFFPDAPADKRAITIRQLLTHTAGFGQTYAGDGIVDRTTAVRRIVAQPLVYPPGRGYRYGDDDYELLAAVLEIATQRRWEELVRTEILERGGLERTGFWCDARKGIPRPVPGAAGSTSQCDSHVATGADWGHRGANGMSSTADDLLKWIYFLRNSTTRGVRELAAIETPQVFVRREPPFDVSYGYGARVYSFDHHIAEIMYSGSGDAGHSVVIRELSSGLVVIVLSNAGQHRGTTWSAFIARSLASRTASGHYR
jgi:CubicO group peptidase (beta-lactamase class C family)